MREDYTAPVWFASEPSERRKNWIARIITGVLLVFIVWLAYTKVWQTPTDNPTLTGPNPNQTSLPGPR